MLVVAASRCGLNVDDRPKADLESGLILGARPDACTKPLRTVQALSDQSWASTAKPSDRSRCQVETYGPEGQYSSKVQQQPDCLTRLASSRCVPASVNKATSGYCADFGTKRSQVQILSPRPVCGLVRVHFDSGARADHQSLIAGTPRRVRFNGEAPGAKRGNRKPRP
jgi:hypothetical protein